MMKPPKIFTYKIVIFDYEGPEQELLVEEFSASTDSEAAEHFKEFQKKCQEKDILFVSDIDDMELYRIDVPEQRTQIHVI